MLEAVTIVTRLTSVLILAGALSGSFLIPAADAQSASTTRVSVAPDGREGKGSSARPSLSADGRYVAFDSASGSLVPGDTNGARDIFVVDRVAATISRVSLGAGGMQTNGDSQRPVLSADGRYVAFWSLASNLVPGDTNGVADVFVRDLVSATTLRASVTADGTQGDGESRRPVISADGGLVAYESDATNLVPGDTNGVADVFVRDLVSATTLRASVAADGTQGDGESERASLSGDGHLVAFHSLATTLVPGDTNGKRDVFVRDLMAATTARVSVASSGEQASQSSFSPSLSANGRYVAFWSYAPNLALGDMGRSGDVFVRDLSGGTTAMVSVSSEGIRGEAGSYDPSIGGDGRYVAFWSAATNFVTEDQNGVEDIFVRDLLAGTTTRVSVSSTGAQGNGPSLSPALSADGHHVAFDSRASNLVADDHNEASDVFVHTA